MSWPLRFAIRAKCISVMAAMGMEILEIENYLAKSTKN